VQRTTPPGAACALVGAVLLATTPVQPWYAVMLLACATVAGWPAGATVVVAGYPYFFAVILADRHAGGTGQLAYCAAALAMLGWQRLSRMRDFDLMQELLGDELPDYAD
jgi:hypothetical protein